MGYCAGVYSDRKKKQNRITTSFESNSRYGVKQNTRFNIQELTVVHGSRFVIRDDACPFHASILRPASSTGPLHTPTVGPVSVALLTSVDG